MGFNDTIKLGNKIKSITKGPGVTPKGVAKNQSSGSAQKFGMAGSNIGVAVKGSGKSKPSYLGGKGK